MKLEVGLYALLILLHKNRECIFSNDFPEVQMRSTEKPKNAEDSKPGIKRSSLMINETLNLLHQDDPLLIDILRNEYLIPPSDLPYNFSNANPNIGGQYEQPLYIKYKFYSDHNKKTDGFFVEAGAFDGEILSNTLAFELEYGWSGLLIEPNPVAFDLLMKKHRKAWAINVCLSTEVYPQIVEFDMAGLVGGIVSKGVRPSKFQKTASGEAVESGLRLDGGIGCQTEILKMQCFPLYSILKALGELKIDYFSLDVEGSEYGILQSLFEEKTNFEFSVATIEHNYFYKEAFHGSELEVKYLLKQNGYKFHKYLGHDSVYVHANTTS